MKTGAALLLSAFLAALSASMADANGVCYDPRHVGDGKNAATVAKDIETIKSKGFTHVRTYISKFGNTLMAEQLAASGLQVSVGVPYGAPEYQEQLAAALEAAKKGNVIYITIGNENLAGFRTVPPEFIAEIKRVKDLAPAGVKVGTVQRNTEFLENIGGLKDLVGACDMIGVNIHPFFTGGQDGATNAIELTKKHWNQALGIAGDKLVLGETGWPSDGSTAGNKGTVPAANAYFGAYKAWSAALPAHKKFYFQMFDQPYKGQDFEVAYGLLHADSSSKFDVSVPTQQPTQAPTTPAPTTNAPTAAPSATPKPSGNSTSSGSLDKDATKTAGSLPGSGTGSLGDAGSVSKSQSSTTASDGTTTEIGGEATTGLITGRTTVDTRADGTQESVNQAGGNSGSTEVNAKSESSSGGAATVAFAVVAGCMAVVAAFGFIYRTRQKAAELEEAEGKPSFAVTPHGGCVL